MRLIKLFVGLLFLFSFLTTGQIKKYTKKSYTYSELSDLFFKYEKNTKLQLTYADLYLKKAFQEKNDIEIATAYDFFSMVYAPTDSKKALFYLDKSIYYSKDRNDSFYPMNSYWSKAVILANQDRVEEAIDNLKRAEELAKKNNGSFYYAIRLNIGKIKSERLGEVEEAITIYRECYNFYKIGLNKKTFPDFYRRTLFSMAEAHKILKNTDSTSYYNRLGYTNSKQNNDEYYKNLFTLNEGANLIVKKDYLTALDSINKAFPYIKNKTNSLNIMASHYYYGKAYEGIGNTKQAVISFTKIDSIYQKSKKIVPEFVQGYPFLIKYYESKGIKERQLYFTTTYLEIEHDFQKKYKQFYNSIVKNYDIPSLIADKTIEIDEITLLNRIVLFCLLLVALVAIYQFYKRRIYKIRFNKLIQNIEDKADFSHSLVSDINMDSIKSSQVQISERQNHEQISSKQKSEIDSQGDPMDLNISKELINELLERLNAFEKEEHYLKSGITVQNLAKDYGTNVKYLSKVVNCYKGKPFVHYVNDLRIEYAVLKLKEDKLYRQFTIEALSKEFGFHSKDSFMTAFHKKTGLKPLFFIQQLVNQNI